MARLKLLILRIYLGHTSVIIVRLFIYTYNLVECLDCGHIIRTFDFCLDLSIQIGKPKGTKINEL